jgi:uncharacterized membrane protein YhiD involved in acid resistance
MTGTDAIVSIAFVIVGTLLLRSLEIWLLKRKQEREKDEQDSETTFKNNEYEKNKENSETIFKNNESKHDDS